MGINLLDPQLRTPMRSRTYYVAAAVARWLVDMVSGVALFVVCVHAWVESPLLFIPLAFAVAAGVAAAVTRGQATYTSERYERALERACDQQQPMTGNEEET